MSEDTKVSSREVVIRFLKTLFDTTLVDRYIKETDAWVGEDTFDGSINEAGDLDPVVAIEGFRAWEASIDDS